MEQKTRCIVLRVTKYGDNKLIIDFLSREEGRVSAVWKITKSRTARVRRQFFQPLSILEVDLERSPRQTMSLLKDARICYSYTSVPFHPVKLSLAFFLAEFLTMATRDLHTEAVLYDYVESSLQWLDTSDRGISNFHLMFMMRMSMFLGFFPDMDSYTPGSLFDLCEGTFCRYAPLHPDYLRVEESEKMQTLMRMSPSNLHLFTMTSAERSRVIDIIILFYRLHIPSFGEMKTLEVFRE